MSQEKFSVGTVSDDAHHDGSTSSSFLVKQPTYQAVLAWNCLCIQLELHFLLLSIQFCFPQKGKQEHLLLNVPLAFSDLLHSWAATVNLLRPWRHTREMEKAISNVWSSPKCQGAVGANLVKDGRTTRPHWTAMQRKDPEDQGPQKPLLHPKTGGTSGKAGDINTYLQTSPP